MLLVSLFFVNASGENDHERSLGVENHFWVAFATGLYLLTIETVKLITVP